MTTQNQPRLYFAYGSNLSLTQMSHRCPFSPYYSLAVLKGWKWGIGPRGYANVVKTRYESDGGKDVVYGLLYVLDEEDEEMLDMVEGVPECYIKMMLDVEILSGSDGKVEGGGESEMGEDGKEGKQVEVLVYVDVERTSVGVCREEYVARMNRGIKDAVERGMPQSYVDDVLRKYVRNVELPKDGEVKDPFMPGGK